MVYVYCFLISLGVTLGILVGLALLIVWALPRYGMQAMRLAMAPRFAPPVVPHKPD